MTNVSLGYDMVSIGPRPGVIDEIREIAQSFRRRIKLILLMGVAGLIAGYAGSYLMTPMYTAAAQLSLDPRRVAIAQPVNAQTQRRDEPLIDSGRADTEAETIKSESVIRSVVTTLGLQDLPELTTPAPGLLRRAQNLIFGAAPVVQPSEEEKIGMATAAVAKNLKVERIDKSYAFSIAYRAKDPVLAARLANAFTQVYIKNQLDAEYEATGQAVAWLKQKSEEIAVELRKADEAANEYQRKNKIATSDGKLIDETQLEKLGEQLTDATSQRIEAQARYDSAMQYSDKSIDDLATADAFQNTVITKLRSDFIDLDSRANTLAKRYGEKHSAVIKLRNDALGVEASIKRELLRYQESYKNDLEVAVEREKSVRDAMNSQIDKAVVTGRAQVELSALQANVAALRAAYEGFLQRYTESQQRQSFPVSEARVISEAAVPIAPSSPRRVLIGAAGTIVGLLGGVAIAYSLEVLFRRIRTRAEAEAATGAECLGYFPTVDRPITLGAKRTSARGLPLDYASQNPLSFATETLRTVRTTFASQTRGQTCPVLGITSCFPNEGKTSLSGNLGYVFPSAGKRVLMVDGDVRNPSLTNKLRLVDHDVRPEERIELEPGFSVVRRANLPFDFLSMHYGAQFIAGAATNQSSNNRRRLMESLEPEYFRNVIEIAQKHYDYILVDLPPIVPLADIRAVSDTISAFVLVLTWNGVEGRVVSEVIDTVQAMSEKLLGSILNKADLKSLPRYGEYVANYYNSDYFST